MRNRFIHSQHDTMQGRTPPRGMPLSPHDAALWMLGLMGFVLGLVLFPLLVIEGLPPLAPEQAAVIQPIGGTTNGQ